jgi:hypothetical protein
MRWEVQTASRILVPGLQTSKQGFLFRIHSPYLFEEASSWALQAQRVASVGCMMPNDARTYATLVWDWYRGPNR